MTAPDFSATTPDYFAAGLIHDYLGSAGSLAFGVPALEAVQAHVMDDGADFVRPCRVVACKELQGGTAARRALAVSILLLTRLRPAQGGASTDVTTTRAQASAWLRAMDDRLRDRDAFEAWLLALPSERRQGWVITAYAPQAMPAPSRKENGVIDYALMLHITLVAAAQTPDPAP